MKIRWFIEGSGCFFQQCGLSKGKIVTVSADELPTNPAQRDKAIDSIIQDEFDRAVYPVWELED